MTLQLSMLDIMTPPPPVKRPPYPCGHKQCECGLLWWDNDRETPNLHPFRYWTCWQRIRRVVACKFDPFKSVSRYG